MKEGAVSLLFIWNLRLRLRVEGNKLWAEGDKLRAEGDKLWAEGDKLWAEAIIQAYGNITMDWMWREDKRDYTCILETGDVFEPIELEEMKSSA